MAKVSRLSDPFTNIRNKVRDAGLRKSWADLLSCGKAGHAERR